MALFLNLPWRWIGAAFLVLLIGLVYLEIKHVGRLEAQLAAATETANVNAQIASQERVFHQRADAAAGAAAAHAERARRQYLDLRQKVTDARDTEDGPLAPVLRHVLDGLPESEKSAAVDDRSGRGAELSAVLSGSAIAAGR